VFEILTCKYLILTPFRSRLKTYRFGTVCKTVHLMLSDRCLSCLSLLSACNVGVLWPNGWTDQDETWLASRLGPGHIVLDGDPGPPPPKGHSPPIIGLYLLWPNGLMDDDATS